ncbi:MAG: heme-binding protein [Rhodospirillales bacterium]|nr:heme-binding protein [Rhodospirillales bacterium]
MSRLTLEQANTIINQAIVTAREKNAPPIAVVVLDDGGHIKAVQREDKASMFRVDVSTAKAWGAVAMDTPSRELAKKAKENPNFLSALAATSGGRLLPNPGGVLIRDGKGDILGAVGISGDTGANDEIYAIAGIQAAGLVADSGQN